MLYTLLNFLFLVFGAAVGIKFADIDLAPVFRLRHRSFWTHGPIIVWLAMYLLSLFPSVFLHWFMVGFLPAHAIHLLVDMFPRNWKGGATIKLYPIKKELAPILSFAWLGFGTYISSTQWLEITGNAVDMRGFYTHMECYTATGCINTSWLFTPRSVFVFLQCFCNVFAMFPLLTFAAQSDKL